MRSSPDIDASTALSYRGQVSTGRHKSTGFLRAFLLLLSVFALCAAPAFAQESYSYSTLGQMNVGNPIFNGFVSPLTPASNGMFYGISAGYGANGGGYLYSVDTFGNSTDIFDFNSSDASAGLAVPVGNLLQGPDGALYGVTVIGGTYNWGVFYKIALDGSNFTILYNFNGASDGGAPVNGITLGSDGNFYAIGNSVFYSESTPNTKHPFHPAAKTQLSLPVQAHGSPHQFLPGLPLRRSSAIAPPSRSHAHPNGQGPSGCNDYPWSAFYQLTPSGNMTDLYCETSDDGLFFSTGPLVETSPGSFWGMTGYSSLLSGPGIFNINSQGDPSTPNFISATPSNISPIGALTGGTDGNFYMSYINYSPGEPCESNVTSGVMQAAFSEVILFTPTSTSCEDANGMLGGLYLATDGGLYGISPGDDSTGTGSLVRYDIGESSISYPYHFVSGSGINPSTYPVQAADGNFYGETFATALSGSGPNVFYSLDTIPNLPAPIVLTTSDPTPPALSPMTLSWQINNSSSLTPPVCVALIDDINLEGGGGWSGILSGSFSGNVYSGVTDVIAPPWPGTYEYQIVCNGQGAVQTQITVPYVYPTATSISGTSPINVGQTATFTANVAVNYNNGVSTKNGVSANYSNRRPTMTGNIVFNFNGTELGKARVIDGQASISMATTTLPYGTYTICAEYSGDNNYRASSTSASYVVSGAPTNVSVGTSVAIFDIGSAITLNASVVNSTNNGVAAPGGSFTFLVDNSPIGTVAVTNGSASLSPSTAAVQAGAHQFSATYNGDILHSSNTSAPVLVNVLKNSTKTTMAVASNPVVKDQSETLTATVISGYLVPTGNVCFFAGDTNFGCAPLVSGVATFNASTTGIKAATYPVRAEYMSDLVHNISKSAVHEIAVTTQPQ
jgi:uncharacterized repeat protein (TIGR03803 family)